MVDKKSKKKLFFVTAALLVVVGYLIISSSMGSYSYFKTVEEVVNDPDLIGRSVRVGGIVVDGTIERIDDGYSFAIQDEGHELIINYSGTMPATFGGGVEVIAEGSLVSAELVEADSVVTKCPSKYEAEQAGGE